MCELVSNPDFRDPLRPPERVNWIRDLIIDSYLNQERESPNQEFGWMRSEDIRPEAGRSFLPQRMLFAHEDYNRLRDGSSAFGGRNVSTYSSELTSREPDLTTKIMRVVTLILIFVVILLISYLLPPPPPIPNYYSLGYTYVPPLDPLVFSPYTRAF